MKKLILVVLLGLLGGSGAAALDANGIIKSRQALMSYHGSNMRTLARMASGDLEFNAAYVKVFAASVAAISTVIPHLFSEGTREGTIETKASGLIFEQPGDFAELAAGLGFAAERLKDSPDVGSFRENFGQFAGACKACHTKFQN